MQSFKQYLKEASVDFAPWHLTNKEEVEKFLTNRGTSHFSGWRVNKDGTVNATQRDYSPSAAVFKEEDGGFVIKVKYRNAKRFDLLSMNLKSLWGLPDTCEVLSINTSGLKTLAHITPNVKGRIYLACQGLESYDCGPVECESLNLGNLGSIDWLKDWKDFPFKPSSYIIVIGKEEEKLKDKGILNMCNIIKKIGHPIRFFSSSAGAGEASESKLEKAYKIINKYQTDVLGCQEAMIDAGLKEYAKF